MLCGNSKSLHPRLSGMARELAGADSRVQAAGLNSLGWPTMAGGKLDGFAVPSVGEQEISVGRLDDSRIRIFSGLIFESLEDAEVLGICADGEIQWSSLLAGVVKREYDASIAQAHSVNSGIWIGQIDEVRHRPG